MTPTQLRAFTAVVRLGSIKLAAEELGVSESAVSFNIAQLRKELGDQLFLRQANGLAFTPGGLRLARRATELLGLQDRTIEEVSRAATGRRLLRVAASSMFGEYAAPGLIESFAGRADDLDVELTLEQPARFVDLLRARAVDVTVGPCPPSLPQDVTAIAFLKYALVLVAAPDHPLAGRDASTAALRGQTWFLGPSAVGGVGLVPAVLRVCEIPEAGQRIFQSHAAATEETKRGGGVALVPSFAAAKDLAARTLVAVTSSQLQTEGTWHLLRLVGPAAGASVGAELARFVTTPRAIQAMVRGTGVTAGRFRPSIHVTLWS